MILIFKVLSKILVLHLLSRPITANNEQLNALIARMENDTSDFARQVEELYKDRCTTALRNCSRNNYDACVARFPSAICYKSDQHLSKCSTSLNDTCAASFDFTVSSVSLPASTADGVDGNPTKPNVSPREKGDQC